MESWNNIDEWVSQYCQGVLSEEDRVKLTAWVEASPENQKEFERMLRVWLRVSAAGKWSKLDRMQENVWGKIIQMLEIHRKRFYLWSVKGAAVAVLLVGIVFVWKRVNFSEEAVPVKHMMTVESGSPKALLILQSGERIELKGGNIHQVVNISGVDVVQDSAGGVRFEDSGIGMEGETDSNRIVVPERGEYYVVLSDGTKVWMNSGSELVFPTRFRGDRREVNLKGEAYFEVVSDQEKPFYVETGEIRVRVLGTAFNVMSYQEDARVEIALLRGKVCFDTREEVFVLKPGEVATLNRGNGNATVRKGDVEAIIAWTSGRFNFEDVTLSELVIKLERWYGVKFVFGDEASKALRFSGAVTKYRPLDYVLDIISKTTAVGFKESGDYIVVYTK